MKNYKNIIVAVELIEKNDAELVNYAEHLNKEHKANVVLVHAVEHIGGYSAYNVGVGFEVEQAIIESSTAEMKRLGKHLGVPENKQIVKVGPAKFVVLEEADKIKADLIIVGSHGRHGLMALLGSTANAVLHGAKCDVLAVRLKK
ncbi:MAG: hypothetical protein ACD_21C00039G0005 [uncultured bacterium]|nr:MAG: hypothetical protein ACD_21C00039G0005 [uncultured bacterium]